MRTSPLMNPMSSSRSDAEACGRLERATFITQARFSGNLLRKSWPASGIVPTRHSPRPIVTGSGVPRRERQVVGPMLWRNFGWAAQHVSHASRCLPLHLRQPVEDSRRLLTEEPADIELGEGIAQGTHGGVTEARRHHEAQAELLPVPGSIASSTLILNSSDRDPLQEAHERSVPGDVDGRVGDDGGGILGRVVHAHAVPDLSLVELPSDLDCEMFEQIWDSVMSSP